MCTLKNMNNKMMCSCSKYMYGIVLYEVRLKTGFLNETN